MHLRAILNGLSKMCVLLNQATINKEEVKNLRGSGKKTWEELERICENDINIELIYEIIK